MFTLLLARRFGKLAMKFSQLSQRNFDLIDLAGWIPYNYLGNLLTPYGTKRKSVSQHNTSSTYIDQYLFELRQTECFFACEAPCKDEEVSEIPLKQLENEEFRQIFWEHSMVVGSEIS